VEPSYPRVTGGGLFAAGIPGVYCPCDLHEHGAAFILCRGLVFYSLRNDKNLPVPDRHIAIPEVNAHFSTQDDQHLIGVFVVKPNELPLNFDEFKVIVVHLGDNLRRPVLGELSKLFAEVDRGLHVPPFSMPGNVPDIRYLSWPVPIYER